MGGYVFHTCESLKSITIGKSVTSIENSAFYECKSLESIKLPQSVTKIGDYAFKYCKALANITIENPKCEIYTSSSTICTDNDSFDGTICGYDNSTAQAYADYYGYKFESLGTAPVITTPAVTTPVITEPNETTNTTVSDTDTNPDTTNTTVSSDGTDTTVTEPTEPNGALRGDANLDGKVNVRDCAFIATKLAEAKGDTLPSNADYNEDGKINVRDAAALASDLAKGEVKS